MTDPAEIASLTLRIQALETSFAVMQRDREHLDGQFKRLELQIGEVRAIIGRVVWLVAAAIIMAGVGFALRGGLHVP